MHCNTLMMTIYCVYTLTPPVSLFSLTIVRAVIVSLQSLFICIADTHLMRKTARGGQEASFTSTPNGYANT